MKNELVLEISELLLKEINKSPINIRIEVEKVLLNYNIEKIDNGIQFKESLEAVINYYLDCKNTEGLNVSTLKNYSYCLFKMSKSINKNITDVNINDLRNYASSMNKMYKRNTVCSKLEIIKAFFTWAHSEGHTKMNIGDRLIVPRKDKNVREYLNIIDIERIRNSCETNRQRAIVEFLLSTGCRVSEISKIKKTDIKNSSVIIMGKFSKERHIFINEKSNMYLMDYLNNREIDSEYLFVGQKYPHKPLSVRAIQSEFNKIGHRANIHLTPHLLRHSFGSLLLQNGASLVTVQELLGHENATTTQIYAKTNLQLIKMEHTQHSVI